MTLLTEKSRAEMQHEKFQREFYPYLGDLYSYATTFVRAQEDVEDLVQETMVKAFKSVDKFETGTNAKAWLFTILRNEFINQYRKKKKRGVEADIDKVGHTIAAPELEEGFIEVTDKVMDCLGDEMQDAISTLKDDIRDLIFMVYVERFKYEEVAEILDIPVNTVRTRLLRARRHLIELLESYACDNYNITPKGKGSKKKD